MIVLAIIVFGFIGMNTDWNSTIQSIKDANYTMIGLGSLTMLTDGICSLKQQITHLTTGELFIP